MRFHNRLTQRRFPFYRRIVVSPSAQTRTRCLDDWRRRGFVYLLPDTEDDDIFAGLRSLHRETVYHPGVSPFARYPVRQARKLH